MVVLKLIHVLTVDKMLYIFQLVELIEEFVGKMVDLHSLFVCFSSYLSGSSGCGCSCGLCSFNSISCCSRYCTVDPVVPVDVILVVLVVPVKDTYKGNNL
jgi:hypothetical protein